MIRQSVCRVILIALFWHRSQWFQDLLKLLIDAPLDTRPTKQTGLGARPQADKRASASCLEVIQGSLQEEGFFPRGCLPCSQVMEEMEERRSDLFLLTLFDEDKQVSIVQNHRLALAAIHKGFPDGSSIGSNRVFTLLLRGMLNSCSP